jgi:hypothetical protein
MPSFLVLQATMSSKSPALEVVFVKIRALMQEMVIVKMGEMVPTIPCVL